MPIDQGAVGRPGALGDPRFRLRLVRKPFDFQAPGSPVTGTASGTLDAVTLASTATAPAAGSLAVTLGAATLAATALARATASAMPSLGAATLASTATAPEVGSLAKTLDDASLAATVTATEVGSLSVSLGAATVSATATAPEVGTVAASLGEASVAATAQAPEVGSLATSLGDAALSATATDPERADVALSLDGASVSATAHIPVVATVSVQLEAAALLSTVTVTERTPWMRRHMAIVDLYEKRSHVFSASINYSAVLHASAGNIEPGDILANSTEGAFVKVSSHLRNGMAKAMALSAGGGVVSVQLAGHVTNALTGLGEGAATLVRVNPDSSRLERCEPADADDEIVGWCETNGDAVLAIGGMGALPVHRGAYAPTEGPWTRGTVVFSTVVVAGGYVGWVCVEDGTPGVWKPWGAVEA